MNKFGYWLNFGTKIYSMGIFVTLMTIAVIIIFASQGFPVVTPTKYVSNLTVMIGGSGIALFISLSIWMYSREREKETSKIISNIENIITDQQKIMKDQGRILEVQLRTKNEKREFAESRCWFFLDCIKKQIMDIKLSTSDPDFIKRNPDFIKRNPDFIKRNPDFIKRNPDFIKRNPDFIKRNPDFIKRNPDFIN